MSEISKYKILIVDDSKINRAILSDILENKFTILEAENGIEALQIIRQNSKELSLILLDLVMPEMDGLEVLAAMNKGEWIDEIPVIMISSENSPTYVERAYELGATDFINRPFNVSVVQKRIANTIMLYSKQRTLINLVSQQVYEKEKNNNLMINILSHIVEFRNGESGLHILHVNTITEAILKKLIQKTDKYKLSYEDIENIVTASSLHDIGKITIPDEILNKPGRLTDEEYEIMKTHSKAGADMLNAMTEYLDEPLVKTAHDICLYHHERYNGGGYPCGLVGDEIPISAQVVSIADVYDALTSERCYKNAYTHEQAVKMITNGECGSFNPILLECLYDISDFLERELKINSTSKRNMREIKKITDEMLNQNKFSVTNNSINYLEQLRIKYEFFASMSQEIQFEYTVATSIITISEWCSEKFGLPLVIVNPRQNEKVVELFNGVEKLDKILAEFAKTTPENPIIQFETQIKTGNTLRHHKAICRVNWSNEDEPKIISVIGKVIDVEDEHQKMLKLEKKASIDTLTNIYNHGHCENLVKEILNDNGGKKYAIILFDLDDFKSANDTYGHMFGDKVLKKVASTLVSSTRKGDVIARIGGDEFLLFIEYTNEETFKCIVKRLCNTINHTRCDSYNIKTSIGAATTEQVGYDYNKLFNSADTALYYSKRNGKNSYIFYEESMELADINITPIEN